MNCHSQRLTAASWRRYPNTPLKVPITSAKVLVALATLGRVPNASRVGKVTSVPPPGTALIIPAAAAAAINPAISSPDIGAHYARCRARPDRTLRGRVALAGVEHRSLRRRGARLELDAATR